MIATPKGNTNNVADTMSAQPKGNTHTHSEATIGFGGLFSKYLKQCVFLAIIFASNGLCFTVKVVCILFLHGFATMLDLNSNTCSVHVFLVSSQASRSREAWTEWYKQQTSFPRGVLSSWHVHRSDSLAVLRSEGHPVRGLGRQDWFDVEVTPILVQLWQMASVSDCDSTLTPLTGTSHFWEANSGLWGAESQAKTKHQVLGVLIRKNRSIGSFFNGCFRLQLAFWRRGPWADWGSEWISASYSKGLNGSLFATCSSVKGQSCASIATPKC